MKSDGGDAFIGIDIDVSGGVDAAAKNVRTTTAKNARTTTAKNARTTTAKKKKAESAAAATSKKRSATAATAGAKAKGRAKARAKAKAKAPTKKKRPPAVPPPPPSLISLLRSDGAALSYFQSLQAHLEHDVDRWKEEAARWKKEARAAEKEQNERRKRRTDDSGGDGGEIRKRQRRSEATSATDDGDGRVGSGNVDADDANGKHGGGRIRGGDDVGGSDARNKGPWEVEKEIPITDDALFGDLDSDNDDEGCADDGSSNPDVIDNGRDARKEDARKNGDVDVRVAPKRRPNRRRPRRRGDPGGGDERGKAEARAEGTPAADIRADRRRRRAALSRLREARRLLDGLGVSLVDVEVVATTTTTTTADAALTVTESVTVDVGGASGAGGADVWAAAPLTSTVDECSDDGDDDDDDLHRRDDGAERCGPRRRSSLREERTLRRRSNEKVAADLAASLQTLIKASSFFLDEGGAGGVGCGSNETAGAIDGEGESDDSGGDEDHAREERLRYNKRAASLRRRFHPFRGGGMRHIPNVYPAAAATVPSTSAVVIAKSDGGGDEENGGNGGTRLDLLTALPEHPAATGLRNLMRVLSIMDVHCRDDVYDEEWRAMFAEDGDGGGEDDDTDEEDKLEDGDDEDRNEDEDAELSSLILEVGMRNRSRLSDRILSSLDIEVGRGAWASADRAASLDTPTVHFHPADVMDDDDMEDDEEKGGCVDGEGEERDDDALKVGYGPKNYNRLATLEEHVAHARIASLMRRRRGDVSEAAELVAGYLSSCAPSLGGGIGGGAAAAATEAYPMLPPALSLCVVEALLAPEGYDPQSAAAVSQGGKDGRDGSDCWFVRHVCRLTRRRRGSDESRDDDGGGVLLLRALALPVSAAVSIWRERSRCNNDRVRDVAVVEVAAHDRLRNMAGRHSWLSASTLEDPDAGSSRHYDRHLREAEGILAEAMADLFSPPCDDDDDDQGKEENDEDDRRTAPARPPGESAVACTLALLTLGDAERAASTCRRVVAALEYARSISGSSRTSSVDVNRALLLLTACCRAHATIVRRQWDTVQLGDGGRRRHTAAAFAFRDTADALSSVLDSAAGLVVPSPPSSGSAVCLPALDAAIACCAMLGDGRRMAKVAGNVLRGRAADALFWPLTSDLHHDGEPALASGIATALIDAGEIPTVRVINLASRPDRMLNFAARARDERLLVVMGPAALRPRAHFRAGGAQPEGGGDTRSSGDYAFDGQTGLANLEDQISRRCDGGDESLCLSDFVKAKWLPGDLRAFDRDCVRGDADLVMSSNTERACALSHVATWMGVERVLSAGDSATGGRGGEGPSSHRSKLLRMFQISGFARGRALLHENENVDPAPVCVVLEDDAVLVDRFSERLASLLEELPRDFHFCSLGYSRPKRAPMIEYSSQLGIPSCLWYLTGYVLSLDGARHLLRNLPVTGPVDSWIGLKMCANWDNTFGHSIGVGTHPKAHAKLPSRKDLTKILKFRAFAASVPLCAQRVGTTATTAASRVSWRDRDTDITYSG